MPSVLTRRRTLLGTVATALTTGSSTLLLPSDASACHTYKSPVDGRVGCGARNRDAREGNQAKDVQANSGPTSTNQNASSNTSQKSSSSPKTSNAIFELCPQAKLLIESETMSWSGNRGRSSIRSSDGMRYLQFDVRKGTAQTEIESEFYTFKKAPLSCAVYEFDVYLSANYDGKATAPQTSGRKGPGGLFGGFNYKDSSIQQIGNTNPSRVNHPELNQGFSMMHNWSSSDRSRLQVYSANRYDLGASYNKSSKKLFGKTYTQNKRQIYRPGRWSRISIVVKLNDDRKSNGRGQVWIDGIKVIDAGNIMWLYEPNKSGGITGYRVRHMYGGNPSRLIPTQNQYERYRNLRIWGVRQ